jgi:type IV pilus assembly protein PilV
MRRAAGFSLIELIIVTVIISVGILGMASMFSSSVKSLSSNEILQQEAQYAQECAERVMATRRNLGFSWFASNTFSCGTNPSGFTRTQNPVGSLYTGNGTGACPSTTTLNCRDVSITVTSTTNAALSSTITLMLVDY